MHVQLIRSMTIKMPYKIVDYINNYTLFTLNAIVIYRMNSHMIENLEKYVNGGIKV